MKKRAEIVIIGGGIIGSAIAFYLAKKGKKDVVLLERDKFIGAGATSKCAGGIRAQFSSEINIKISLMSENLLENFQEETGEEGIFDQCGYLFLVSTHEQEDRFRKNLELQQKNGVPAEWLSIEEIRDLAPKVKLDDILGGTFCKKDGIGDPHVFTQGYASGARKLGTEIELETDVTALNSSGGKIASVSTDKGDIECDLVIDAAGPHLSEVAKLAGIDLPVQPVKRQISTTSPLSWLQPTFPMVVDVSSGLYFHRESGGLLLGWADPDTPPGFDESLDPDYTDEIIMKAMDRIPALEDAGIASSWAGLYAVSPDHHAILGHVPGVENLIIAGGFSGHGFMHGPAVGLLIAEMIVDSKPSIDLSPLSIERFKEEKIIKEDVVI